MSQSVSFVFQCVWSDNRNLVSVVLFIQPLVSLVFTLTKVTDLKH